MNRLTELTGPEARALRCIRSYVKKRGYPPSVREIAKAGGWASTSTVFDNLRRLEAKGYIKVDDRVARGIKVLEP